MPAHARSRSPSPAPSTSSSEGSEGSQTSNQSLHEFTFTFHDYNHETDNDGIHFLLQPFIPGHSISQIIENLENATVVKQEEESECLAIIAVNTKMPNFLKGAKGTEKKKTGEGKFLKPMTANAENIIEENGEKNPRFLVHERLVNMPLEIIAQLYRIIRDELSQAEPPITDIQMLSKTVPMPGNHKAKKAKVDKSPLIYLHAEHEFILPFAESSVDIPGRDGQNWKIVNFTVDDFDKAVKALLQIAQSSDEHEH